MIYQSPTYLVPTHPPTTLPLEEGEMVYKVTGKIDLEKLKSLYKSYHYMTNSEVYNTYLRHRKDVHIAERKSNGEIVGLTTKFFGYVNSSYTYFSEIKCGGYYISWEEGYRKYVNFEEEHTILPLKDINLLDPQELARRFKHER